MKAKLILFLIILCSCKRNHSLTYEEGIERCKERIAQRQKEAPGRIVLSNPDCIVGAQLPDFTAKTLSGKVIDHDYFEGKYSIINFWFKGCPPCVAEIPLFNSVIKKYGVTNFNYISIGRDDEPDVINFLGTHPWDFEIIPNGRDIIENNFKTIWGYPITFVTDRKAKIIAAYPGLGEKTYKDFTDFMETLVN